MNTLDFIDTVNAKTSTEILAFRREVAREVPSAYSRRLFDYRFHNPYFGYVEIQNDACQPFYMLTNNDDAIAQQYLWHGKNGYLPASVREWVLRAKRASVVFDVGAHTGLFTLLACFSNPGLKKVVAFEPLPRAHARIFENLIVNGLVAKVSAERVAVARTTGEETLFIPGDDYQITSAASCSAPDDASLMHRTERCPSLGLDAYVASRETHPDLVKIRTEGTEPDILAGAEELIGRRKTTFLVEARPAQVARTIDLFRAYKVLMIDDEANSVMPPEGNGAETTRTILAIPE